MQRRAKKCAETAQVHFKAYCIASTSFCEENFRQFSPSTNDIAAPSPLCKQHTISVFALRRSLPSKCQIFNLTEVILLFQLGTKNFYRKNKKKKKLFIDLTLCSIPDDMERRTDIAILPYKEAIKKIIISCL